MTSPHLAPLFEAVQCLDEAWADAESGSELSRAQLVAAHRAIGVVQRRLDGLHAEVAAGIARESRPELGAEGLAKQRGFRTPATMIAATTGGSTGDASRLVKVGEATAPRANLLGEALPPRYPFVQAALGAGEVSAAGAAVIVSMLDRARLKVDAGRIGEAERLLVERAGGLSLDEVRKLVARAEAWLDPDGVAPREEQARSQRSLTMFERDGSLHLTLQTDIASGAPITAAIHAFVGATFQARTQAPDAEAGDADHRTVAMIQADALTAICEHAIACDNGGMPVTGATVIVRVGLEDLTAGTGVATIDGTDRPVSISTCRRIAASGGVIPVVLGSDSEILDWGREKRLFTRAQRLALVERDGGCVMCALPPQMTKAHHLRWWQRDTGPTDLANGVLLCESCHHRIHDNGWDIRIDGTGTTGRVWLIPPATVDPTRTPRLGGRARYDIAA
ncbi:HNH endonuclease [Microbacterium hydrocarbonoxydans]|uniref:HNH endonuclease n=1 Tax=Microbacterium hydrocarbonoxydans TaxID=273678 RepID=UPI00203B79BB|nr:HNH endonuclease signature motif containing protein [Microbacterium hydrocarbonoxydans]MCM3780616.1 HNH endonuclease [Microbacterium hydrocarbonoxydans]